jgi:Ca2+-binding EF-hand superfamily protein
VLQDMYAPLQDLAPASFAALPKLFEQLDDDSDEWLRREELANLRAVPAHVEIEVTFTRQPAVGEPRASVRVVQHTQEVSASPGATADRVVLNLGKTRLVLAAQDLLAALPPPDGRPEREPEAYGMGPASLAETQVRLVVHDESDAVFDELDANADGQLGEREIAQAPERLRRYDADGDGQLAGEETPYEMIVAFVRGEPLGETSFTTPPSAAQPVDAAAPEWFASADLNRDGDVSRREFVGSLEQFAALDKNGDGFIALDEAVAAKSQN